MAVGTVADHRVDEAWTFHWLHYWSVRGSGGLPGTRAGLEELTKASCTAPQKQVAVAVSLFDQPSPPKGMYTPGFGCSADDEEDDAVSTVLLWMLILSGVW